MDDVCDRSTEFAKLGMIVVKLHYRLAPEHRFPTAVEDSYSTLSYIFKKEHELLEKADLSRVVIIGDSAGGNLSAVLPLLARDRGLTTDVKISHQILIYPTMLQRNSPESYTKYANGYLLSKNVMFWINDQYLDDEKHYNNPYANPLKAESLENLPSALIILATDDILYDDGKMYGEALKQANVTVEFKEYVSAHGFFGFLGLNAEEIEAFYYIRDYLKRNGILNS
jgi:acetyl esterase